MLDRRFHFTRISCFLTALVLLGFFSGCAPKIGLTLPVPSVPDVPSLQDSADTINRLRVHVGHFQDERLDSTMVTIDGRDVGSEGAVDSVVQEGFMRYFTDSGASVAVLDSPSIEGSVKEWSANVDPSFPTSTASAVAKLAVVVRDSRAHPIYRGTFTGEASIKHPMLGEEEVRRLLGQAMGSAIEAAVRDEEMIRQLRIGNLN